MICSAWFKYAFDISVSLSAKEKNILSQKSKVLIMSLLLWYCFEPKNYKITKIMLAWWGKKSKTQKLPKKLLNYVF